MLTRVERLAQVGQKPSLGNILDFGKAKRERKKGGPEKRKETTQLLQGLTLSQGQSMKKKSKRQGDARSEANLAQEEK